MRCIQLNWLEVKEAAEVRCRNQARRAAARRRLDLLRKVGVILDHKEDRQEDQHVKVHAQPDCQGKHKGVQEEDKAARSGDAGMLLQQSTRKQRSATPGLNQFSAQPRAKAMAARGSEVPLRLRARDETLLKPKP